MNDIVSPVQNISYTDKDFVSVYEELLSLTKELTSKWDPSISNESDPGVILLKLNAVIADKCNYAIDKSILECFPLSVTQETNARQLFEQLGYYMHWYKSATTEIFVKWIADPVANQVITIPKFTMVSDSNDAVIYTLLGPNTYSINGQPTISDQNLVCDGNDGITFSAIQGLAVNYEINDQTLITVSNLDQNNRLYFPTTDIAENGIFITNTGENNYVSWVKKDNLLVENLGNTYYKFGVSRDTNSCYIEFPEDAEALFREGINITYIRTNGEYGNISSQYISKFYNFNTVILSDNSTVTITTDNVLVTNYSSAEDGINTENIDDAYRGYKKTVGTFQTLITLRDYINYINNSHLVSNGFVCDRNNDIQYTYRIITSVNDINQTVNIVEKSIPETEDEQPINLMDAFSLKLYLMQYVDSVNLTNYVKSYQLMTNSEQAVVKNYVNDVQTINHDFLDIVDPSPAYSHICMFKNKCPIECTIITQGNLTNTQLYEVKSNIVEALYTQFNSKKLDFGDKFPYELVYSTILNADVRIKNVSLGNIDYVTYAVYQDSNRTLTYTNGKWLNNEWQEDYPRDYGLNPINPQEGATLNLPPIFTEINLIDGEDVYLYSNSATLLESCVFNKETYIEQCENTSLYDCYNIKLFEYDDGWTLDSETVDLADYGLTLTETPTDGDKIKLKLSYVHQFRNDIYIKSILAGVTQFFVKDEKFDYKLNNLYTGTQANVDNLVDIKELWSNVDIEFTNTNNDYVLKQNESLQFYAPNLIEKDTYSNYVKFEYKLYNEVTADTDYQLVDGEYIIFYWKSATDEPYQYHSYGSNTIIHPTFNLTGNINSNIANVADNSNYYLLREVDGVYYEKSSAEYGSISLDCDLAIANITSSDKILSGIKKISIKQINSFTIDSSSNYGLYWTTNEENNGYYVLFDKGESSRILNSNEFFIFTNSTYTSYTVLSSGTRLTRNVIDTEWKVKAVDPSSIVINGLTALSGNYFTLDNIATLEVVENSFTTLGNKTEIVAGINNKENSPLYTFSCVPTGDIVVELFDVDTWLNKGMGNSNSVVINYTNGAWELDLAEYGITISGTPVNGNKLTITKETHYSLKFDRDGYDIDIGNLPTSANFDDDITLTSSPATITFTTSPILSKYYWSVIVDANYLSYDADTDLFSYTDSETNYTYKVYENTSTLYFTVVDGNNNVIAGTYDVSIICPIYYSSVVTPRLSDFTFTYKVNNSNQSEKLSTVDLNDLYSWNGRSLLGINISPTVSQILLANQSITYKDIDNNEVTITGQNFVDISETTSSYTDPRSYYPKCLLASMDVHSDGATKLETYLISYDENNNRNTEYLKLYPFVSFENLVGEGEDVNIISNNQGDTTITFKPNHQTISLAVDLPVGDYILPVTIYDNNIKLTVELDSTQLSQMCELYEDSPSDIEDDGKYYLYMNISSITPYHVLDITVEEKGESTDLLSNCSIKLSNCYKYIQPELDSDIYYTDKDWVQKWINFYDENHIFQYDYNVPEEIEIKYPLNPQEFFNTNHIYNKFTIGQIASISIK